MADPVVDEIKQRVDIADLVSQTVDLKRSGRYLKGLCPFHREKTPSFYVYPEQGTFHCFGCGKTGDAFTWLQETQHLSFGDALRQLASRAGVRLPERAPAASPPDPEATAAIDALKEAAVWYHAQLLHTPDGERARRYLHGRGVRSETAERFGLGWAPERWEGLTGHLLRKGFTAAQLEEAGLAIAGERGLHDRFRGRVIFPIRDAGGNVGGFGGRALGDGQPKYLNSPQTPFFDKSATLYALDLAKTGIRREGYAVVVEGYMDAVLPHQEGFGNIVASLGTALTERQIELLRRYSATIVLALDADAAGQAATLRGLEIVRQTLAEKRRPVPGPATRTGYLSLSAGQVKIAMLTGGKDPDEIVRDSPEAWRQIVEAAVPMMEHKLRVELARVDLHDPQSKQVAVQELARFLVQVPDRIEWAHYVDVIAQRLRLDVPTVRDVVTQAERTIRREERRREAAARAQPQSAATGRPATRPDGRTTDGAQDSPKSERARSEQDAQTTPDRDGRSAGGDVTAPDSGAAPATPSIRSLRTEIDVTEEHLVSSLLLSPHLIHRLPARLAPEDFRVAECRELYRAVLAYSATTRGLRVAGGTTDSAGATGDTPAPGGPGFERGGTDDPFRPVLDDALRGYYDALLARARKQPLQTDSQLEADMIGVVRRIKERNLREQLREAQFLLAEAESSGERQALQNHVERLATQLGRIQLERSRAALYTSAPH